MDWPGISAAILAIGGLSIRAIDLRFRRSATTTIKELQEIANSLPKESSARSQLFNHIDERVIALVDTETNKRRSWSGFAIAIIVLFLPGALLIKTGIDGSTIWTAIGSALILAGIIVTPDELKRTYRDDKGRIIKVVQEK